MTEINPHWFYNKRLVVVGLGISGFHCARWLVARGADVVVNDIRPINEINQGYVEEIKALGIDIQAGVHKRKTFLNSDMVVISPGVPLSIGPLQMAAQKGVPILGELELASRVIKTPIIAVTGTNGKTTVATLAGVLLKNAGYRVFVGGNLGTPLMVYAAGPQDADYAVVEVSSFQLETIETFKPFISIILNISPDHLDRYDDFESYARTKFRIFKNQGSGQYIILNQDDQMLAGIAPSSEATVYRYGYSRDKRRQAFIQDRTIQAGLNGAGEKTFSLEKFKLPGKHNLENLLAVVICGLITGIKGTVLQNTIDTFKGLPHRLERVAEHAGVMFYNDSKATNIDAAIKAVTSMKTPVILIAGGRHKGADYNPLAQASRGKVKRAVFFGEAKELLSESFKKKVPVDMASDMREAVSAAFAYASAGDAVLLAPACSSFDMFTDYVHRARAFKEAVERVIRG
jgi:UDP-N-acetylmuramoylalanine--D-glutamate ligase